MLHPRLSFRPASEERKCDEIAKIEVDGKVDSKKKLDQRVKELVKQMPKIDSKAWVNFRRRCAGLRRAFWIDDEKWGIDGSSGEAGENYQASLAGCLSCQHGSRWRCPETEYPLADPNFQITKRLRGRMLTLLPKNLPGTIIKNMELVQEFEFRLCKAVTFMVDRDLGIV